MVHIRRHQPAQFRRCVGTLGDLLPVPARCEGQVACALARWRIRIFYSRPVRIRLQEGSGGCPGWPRQIWIQPGWCPRHHPPSQGAMCRHSKSAAAAALQVSMAFTRPEVVIVRAAVANGSQGRIPVFVTNTCRKQRGLHGAVFCHGCLVRPLVYKAADFTGQSLQSTG